MTSPETNIAPGAVLLKTEKDLSHRKGPKRIVGHRKGLIFAIFLL